MLLVLLQNSSPEMMPELSSRGAALGKYASPQEHSMCSGAFHVHTAAVELTLTAHAEPQYSYTNGAHEREGCLTRCALGSVIMCIQTSRLEVCHTYWVELAL